MENNHKQSLKYLRYYRPLIYFDIVTDFLRIKLHIVASNFTKNDVTFHRSTALLEANYNVNEKNTNGRLRLK